MKIAIPRGLADGALPFGAATVIFLSFIFGGSTQQGFWSDAIIQLASLGLLGLALVSFKNIPRDALILVCVLVALPILQLIPMPPTLWTLLPDREALAKGYEAANVSLPWLPISVAPSVTFHSFTSLLPGVALFLAALQLSNNWRRNLVLIVFAILIASVILDLLQMMQGQASLLRFYATTNVDRAVGFFANSNHNAAFLYSAIPLGAAFWVGFRHQPQQRLLLAPLLLVVVIGLSLAQSRAGLILGLIAGLCCILLVVWNGNGMGQRRLWMGVLGVNVLALFLAFQFGFVGFEKRMQDSDILGDLRWPVASVTVKVAGANLPFGSGFGTFVPAYQMAEPRLLLLERFVNRAHNDWLEFWLEGGIFSVLGLVVFIGWFLPAVTRVWKAESTAGSSLAITLARASSIVIALLLVHSTIDYPLRTTSLLILFSLACALLISRNDTSPRPVQ